MSSSSLCPCVNPWLDAASIGLVESGCQQIELSRFDKQVVTTTVCPDSSTFGTYCHNWWNATEDCSGHDSTDTCGADWCFVNSQNCSLAHINASAAASAASQNLFLSYEACGNLPTYQFQEKYRHLLQGTIRVAYPDVEEKPYIFTSSTDATAKTGIIQDFINQVFFVPLQLQIDIRNVSQVSRERYPDPLTACTHDVALGEADLCLGVVFRTTERLLISSFTQTLMEESQALVVLSSLIETTYSQQGTQDLFVDYILIPFQVFTWDAWFIIWITILYMAVSFRIIHRSSLGKAPQDPIRELANATYNGMINVTSGGVADVPDSPRAEEKLMIFGFNFFAFIFVSAYTASFTLSLVQSTTTTSTTATLQDIVDVQGGKICVLTSLQHLVISKYSSFLSSKDLLTFPEHDDIIQALTEGQCMGGIVSKPYHENKLATDMPYCVSAVAINLNVLEIPLAIPAALKYTDPMNYVIEGGKTNGLFDSLLTNYEQRQLDTPICVQSTSDGSNSNSSSGKLTSANLALPLITTVLCTTLGWFVFFWRRFRSNKSDTTNQSNECEGDTKEDHKAFREWLRSLTPKELLDAVEAMGGVSPLGLDAAINALPDKSKLADLLLARRTLLKEEEDPPTTERFQSESTAVLYRSLADDLAYREKAEAALCEADPKPHLIRLAILRKCLDREFVLPNSSLRSEEAQSEGDSVLKRRRTIKVPLITDAPAQEQKPLNGKNPSKDKSKNETRRAATESVGLLQSVAKSAHEKKSPLSKQEKTASSSMNPILPITTTERLQVPNTKNRVEQYEGPQQAITAALTSVDPANPKFVFFGGTSSTTTTAAQPQPPQQQLIDNTKQEDLNKSWDDEEQDDDEEKLEALSLPSHSLSYRGASKGQN